LNAGLRVCKKGATSGKKGKQERGGERGKPQFFGEGCCEKPSTRNTNNSREGAWAGVAKEAADRKKKNQEVQHGKHMIYRGAGRGEAEGGRWKWEREEGHEEKRGATSKNPNPTAEEKRGSPVKKGGEQAPGESKERNNLLGASAGGDHR